MAEEEEERSAKLKVHREEHQHLVVRQVAQHLAKELQAAVLVRRQAVLRLGRDLQLLLGMEKKQMVYQAAVSSKK